MFDRRVVRGSTFAAAPVLVRFFRSWKSVCSGGIKSSLFVSDRWRTIDSRQASGSQKEKFGEETGPGIGHEKFGGQSRFATPCSRPKTRAGANGDIPRGGGYPPIFPPFFFFFFLILVSTRYLWLKLQLFEKPDEVEVATQTDYFLDKPLTPKYCPQKIGEDVSTQIEPGDVSSSFKFLSSLHGKIGGYDIFSFSSYSTSTSRCNRYWRRWLEKR